MAHIVTGNCENCRFTDCVTVCPVDCFHGDDTMLYIDPEECIDCAACVEECPVQAIYAEDDVPADQEKWIAINAEKAPGLPVVNEREDPLPSAEGKKADLGL
ncbi:MAG: 4Fe-4S binding protein [Candidatus Krumholzibacteriia bacterium]|nr:ferredoxin family protein [Candidatus Latescibacterota bacterium]MCB9517040.1 ferredoxin family protein [Candidatus Latescibacterota bacterium]